MPIIHLTTVIHASVNKVFSAARRVDMLLQNIQFSDKYIISGKRGGVLEEDNEIIWELKKGAKQTQLIHIKLTSLSENKYFQIEMLRGNYAKLLHKHYFKQTQDGTIMIEKVEYEPHPSKWQWLLGNKGDLAKLKKQLEDRDKMIKKQVE